MLKLPSTLFTNIYVYASPKDAFASKRVCKHFRHECSTRTLWLQLLKTNDPVLALVEKEEPERAMLEILRAKPQSDWKLEQFEFILEYEGGIIHRWQKGKYPIEATLSPEAQAKLRQLFKSHDRLDSSCVMTLYVIFHGSRKYFRKGKFHIVVGEDPLAFIFDPDNPIGWMWIHFDYMDNSQDDRIIMNFEAYNDQTSEEIQYGDDDDNRFLREIRQNFNF